MNRPASDSYAAHAAHLAPAAPPGPPLALGLGLTAPVAAFLLVLPMLGWLGLPEPLLQAIYTGTTPLAVIAALALFAVPAAALAWALRRTEGRALTSLLGHGPSVVPQALAVGRNLLILTVVIQCVTVIPALAEPEFVRPLLPWLGFALIALPAILIQCGAEELLYRGYLQQRLALRFRSPLIWMVVPSMLFALAHGANVESLGDRIVYIGWTFVFGLMAADLTARAGSLGPAIALHVVNNLFSFLLAAPLGAPMSGLALVVMPPLPPGAQFIPEDLPLAAGLIGVTIWYGPVLLSTWLAARIALRR